MGGEAGIGGTEGGIPTVVDKSDPTTPEKPHEKKTVKSKEQKEAEKKERTFDNNVAILADKLWLADVLRKGKDSHSYYRDLARKSLIEKGEANARRRKEREDKKKREEPTPGPDIPKAPPDQSGEKTAGTEEIAISEAHTQDAAQQSPLGQQEELAGEDLYIEGIRDELDRLDELDKKIIIKPEDQRGQEKTGEEEGGQETQEPVSDEELFSRMIEATAKRLGKKFSDVPLALVEAMRERFLAKQAAKQRM